MRQIRRVIAHRLDVEEYGAGDMAVAVFGLRVAFLYDDSLGTEPGVDTYVGMIDTDTDTIVSALR